MRSVQPAALRVLARVREVGTGCWIFEGSLNHNGYGIVQLGRGKGTARAHRVVWEYVIRLIPESMTLDHVECGNHACVNPAHMEVVTRPENTRRQWQAGRADPGRRNREKTHCKRGHEFTPQNTRIYRGRRHCRSCRRFYHLKGLI